jgi:hypothetical protein
MEMTLDTLTRIGRLEELLIWIINNNQDKNIKLPDEDVFVQLYHTASTKAEAEMKGLEFHKRAGDPVNRPQDLRLR